MTYRPFHLGTRNNNERGYIMRYHLSRTARVALVIGMATFLGTIATAQAGSCDGNANDIRVKIKVKDNKASEVVKGDKNEDNLHACPGDTIEWKLNGKNFEISFPDNTPFDFDTENSSDHKLTATVRPDAESDTYKYSITIDGGEPWDPTIIVD